MTRPSEESRIVPQRIQLSRRAGWRKPPDALVVSRPSRWGNPFPLAEYGRDESVRRYRDWVFQPEQAQLRADARAQLAGRALACWCPPGEPCHADVLIEIANGTTDPGTR